MLTPELLIELEAAGATPRWYSRITRSHYRPWRSHIGPRDRGSRRPDRLSGSESAVPVSRLEPPTRRSRCAAP
jgi:hypothetical protein